MTMINDPQHPIIDAPFNYDIVDFKYHVDLSDNQKSYIDLTLLNKKK